MSNKKLNWCFSFTSIHCYFTHLNRKKLNQFCELLLVQVLNIWLTFVQHLHCEWAEKMFAITFRINFLIHLCAPCENLCSYWGWGCHVKFYQVHEQDRINVIHSTLWNDAGIFSWRWNWKSEYCPGQSLPFFLYSKLSKLSLSNSLCRSS